jgi:hypothetical protein
MNYNVIADSLKKSFLIRKKKSLLLTAVATLGLTAATMAQNVPSYVPTNGLVGWWPFNGNANDESGNGNNGTVNGATQTSDRFGNINSAYNFDGIANYIFVPFNSNLNSSSVSISGWLNANQLGGVRGLVSRWNQANNPCSNYSTSIDNLTNNLTGACSIYQNTVLYSNSSISTNLWYHFSYVHNQSLGGKVYINGVLLASNLLSGSICVSGNDLYFGAQKNISSIWRFFDGKLDDIGIWNRALTQQEITDLYNGNICYQTITVTDTLLINMGITGYNPVTYNNTIKIFPNPTNDHITIDYGNYTSLNGYQLKIENSLGQQVFQTNINQQSNYLSLTNWGGNGLYFVRVIDPQGNTIDIRKIVLQ